MEHWKQIPGFPNYQASTAGRIRSINPRKGSRANVNGGIIGGWVQQVSPRYSRQCVALRRDGKTFIRKVHRVVLETFRGPCPDGMECRHKNGNSLDNRLANIRWGTDAENVKDCIRHGRKKSPPTHYAEQHHNSKMSSAQVAEIRKHKFKRGDLAVLAERFGVCSATIARIRDGTTRRFE